jgi:DNA-binding NarL/FixJ family response regulator
LRVSEAITVFVADDHPLFLDAIARVVSGAPDFELVGCTTPCSWVRPGS